jgi:hypothetical protein
MDAPLAMLCPVVVAAVVATPVAVEAASIMAWLNKIVSPFPSLLGYIHFFLYFAGSEQFPAFSPPTPSTP